MADSCMMHRLDTEIVCVDTWLGATEFWTDHSDPKRYQSLGLKNGYPTVYYQFLANVFKTGHQDHITPFPQSSLNAARFLAKNEVKVDMVYLDGSHEYDDVLSDITAYWPLIRSGGVMVGDDYCEYWQGVIDAVTDYFGGEGVHVETETWTNEEGAPSDYWKVRKWYE